MPETGLLFIFWHADKFLNPCTDGIVLPILHLHGFKISNPCILAKIPEKELFALFKQYIYKLVMVESDNPTIIYLPHAVFTSKINCRSENVQNEKIWEFIQTGYF